MHPEKSALETSRLCIKLFSVIGAEVPIQDTLYSLCTPSANQVFTDGGPKPIICKLIRRLVKEYVMAHRKDAIAAR